MSSSAVWSSTPAPTRVRPPRRQRVGGLSANLGNPVTTYLVIGFVVGLLVGLPVLGWWLWPVHTSNAVPSDLAQAYREAYVAMAADSYALSGDLALAKARLSSWSPEESARIVASLQEAAAASGSTVQTTRLQQLAADLGLLDGSAAAAAAANAGSAGEAAARAAAPQAVGASPLLIAGAVLLASGLVLGGFLVRRQGGLEKFTAAVKNVYSRAPKLPHADLSALRRAGARRREDGHGLTTPSVPSAAAEPEALFESVEDDDEASLEDVLAMLAQEVEIDERDETPAGFSDVETVPVAEPRHIADDADSIGVFMATYRHGSDDMFDTSYYLSKDGEFLGEAGVGVAETIGDASPEQACAMELWLFDKGDIRTTTKLLVTDYALDDPDIREMLAGRGELVRASAGQTIRLETAGLRAQIQVLSIKYGDAPQAPARSYFQELTLETRVHRK